MYKILTLSIIISFTFLPKLLFGQLKLEGKVVDSNGVSIEFASIGLFKDSSNIAGTITDSTGSFSIDNIAAQSYVLKVSLVGMSSSVTEILLKRDTAVIVHLGPSSNKLQEVLIKSDRPLIERKIDRVVFNVGAANSVIGGDAIDVLKITPRISVENGKLSMIGKSGMTVMINDKIIQLSGEALINLLKSIRAEDIQSIEVIPNPPAQYSASGNSGMINIKLKKAMSNSWNSSLYGVYQQATYPTGIIGGSFNLQQEKLSLSIGGSFNDGSNAPVETNHIFYPAEIWSEKNERRDYSRLTTFRSSLDYELSSKISAGIQFIDYRSHLRMDEKDRVELINNTTSEVDSSINSISNTKGTTSLDAFNFHAIYKFDTTGKRLAFDFDLFNYISNNDRISRTTRSLAGEDEIIQGSYRSFDNIGIQKVNNYSFNMVMNHPLRHFDLSYGAKLSFSNTNNNIKYYDLTSGNVIIDPTQSNVFLYTENTQALFASVNKKINEKWETQFGIRAESTQTTGKSIETSQINHKNYFELFPTAYLNYTPNDKNALSLNFGRRINRPPYYRLNPFKWYSNPYSYAEGNPYLKPSFSYNLELNYILLNNFSTTLYATFEKNGFDQVTYVDGQIQRVYAENFFNSRSQGISESYTFKKIKWFTCNASFDLNYSTSKSTKPNLLPQNNGFNSSFSLNNDIAFNKDKTLVLNVNYDYSFTGVSGLDKVSSYSQLNLTFKYLMFKNKFQIALYGNDILKSNTPSYTSYTNGIKIVYKNYYDIRFFRVTLVYRFGSNTLKTKQNDVKNQDERNRL